MANTDEQLRLYIMVNRCGKGDGGPWQVSHHAERHVACMRRVRGSPKPYLSEQIDKGASAPDTEIGYDFSVIPAAPNNRRINKKEDIAMRPNKFPKRAIDIVYNAILPAILLSVSSAVNAASVVVSVATAVTYDAVSYQPDDLFIVDTVADTGALLESIDGFTTTINVDGMFIRSDGRIWLSTTGNATLGATAVLDGDIVEYDATTDTGTVVFSESLFDDDEDVDALFVRSNGNILLSTETPATLGGLSFDDSDVVEYNPNTDIATMFLLASSVFDGDYDVDAFHVLHNGNYVLSTRQTGAIGGVGFTDEDLVEYDPVGGTASLLFVGDGFTGQSPNINAAHVLVPIPAAGWLFGSALVLLGWLRSRID
jgi:hypothetical protein